MFHKWQARAATAFALFLVLAGAWIAEPFVHTDDGCFVEVHCLACRHIVGTTAVGPILLVAGTPAFQDSGAVSLEPRRGIDDPAAERALSRGPPLV